MRHPSAAFVLLPASKFLAGAQAPDPDARNHDPHAERDERPLIAADLAAIFLAKTELTFGQWTRLAGEPPEPYLAQFDEPHHTLEMPAFGPSGEWSRTVLGAYGLELPTSIGWEYAARAGTTSVWWCGDDLASLAGCGNVADLLWQRGIHYADEDIAGAVSFEDGDEGCARVGRYRPNAFGFHDTIGNVAEWCRDVTIPQMTVMLPETCELYRQPSGLQIVRGGSHAEGAFWSRSAAREFMPSTRSGIIGVRASRRLDS